MSDSLTPAEPSESGGVAVSADLLPLELMIVDHYGRQGRCLITHLPAVLGRSETAAVRLSDPWVSHEHCTLLEQDGMLIVRDLDSKNGVFLHGARVLESEVQPGDCLTVGRTEITVRYRGQNIEGKCCGGDAVAHPPLPRCSPGPHTEELLY